MRIIDRIQHPDMLITLFHMNDKYIVKFEAGLMEQIFKFSQEQFPGVEQIKNALDETFLNKVIMRFHDMLSDLKAIKQKAG